MKTPNLDRPAFTSRPSMRPRSLSTRIQTAQSLAVRKPKPVTLAMPKDKK